MKNKILSLFSNTVPYIKELRQITGSVTSAILMQQLDYWFSKKPQGFYKYGEPPKGESKTYRIGDSWTEELGFSVDELRTAYRNIGTSYTSKTEFKKALDNQQVFINDDGIEMMYARYHDRGTGNSFYYRNDKLVDSLLDNLVRETEDVHLRETEDVGLPMPLETDNAHLRETDNAHLHVRTENTSTENTSTKTPIAEEPQSLEIIPKIPIVKLDTLNSKQDVLQALINLGRNCLEAQSLAKTVTHEEIKAIQAICKKKHKLCTCPTQKEKPLLKVLNEGINILSSGAVDWAREGANANALCCKLRISNYTLEDVVYCMAWAYQTGAFDMYAYSLISIPKLMPKYLDLNRTGKLKDSLMGVLKETATQRNDRRFEAIQNNEEEFITSATRHNETFREQHGIAKQPII